MRLDKYLVDEGYFESRNRANEAIKSAKVKIDGKVAKASSKVNNSSNVEIKNEKFYISRAARKLESFLSSHSLEISSKQALDIGSSTGGFAQILLENSVKSLTCVDVGTNQLHSSLRDDSRISLFESTDIRDFNPGTSFELVACDVSFISILKIIDHIDILSKDGSLIIILYKPQFEVGKDVKRDNNGVVQDLDAICRNQEKFEEYAISLGWKLQHKSMSNILGKEGNQEYVYSFTK